ncbi:TPA: hypothetical protein NJ473_004499 [Vibrio parahaemolyticus]|nr:hypothetical protein [Vibrio parahaemolyticus]HCG7781600.1 hypothetical protein [Vibrio parahaemolyticus]HCH4904196.1 hypothetical protein [Vibrio parahaemolyticus]
MVDKSELIGDISLSMYFQSILHKCSWYFFILVISVLLPQSSFAKAELEPLNIDDVSQYVDDCSAMNLAICVSGFSYLKATDETILSLVVNNSLMENKDPRTNLKFTMLLHLLAFNSAVAREHGVVDDFINLGISKHGQEKLIVIGEIYSGQSKLVGYYKRVFGTGYLTYDIANSDEDPITFYISRNEEELY